MVRVLTFLAILLVPTLAWAECPGDKLVPARGYEQITVSTTVKTLTIPVGTTKAVVLVETQSLRFTDNGTTPTSSVGSLATSQVEIEVCAPQLGEFRMIRATGTDSAVSVRYYGQRQ